MARKGRSTLLTKERQARLLQAVAAGNYVETAARYAGISETTYYRWMQEGGAPGAPAKKRELWEAVRKAEAEAEVRGVVIIQTAAQTQWQAQAWLLERKYPAKWGRKQQITGADGGPIQTEDVTQAADMRRFYEGNPAARKKALELTAEMAAQPARPAGEQN